MMPSRIMNPWKNQLTRFEMQNCDSFENILQIIQLVDMYRALFGVE